MTIYLGLAEKPFNRFALIGVAFILALLYEILAFNHWGSFGFFAFIVIFIGTAIAVAEIFHLIRRVWAFLLLIPPFIIGLDIVIYNNNLVQGFAPLLCILFLILFSLTLTVGKFEGTVFKFSQIPIPNIIRGIINALKDVLRNPSNLDRKVVVKIIIGLILALPLVFIFGSLFMNADQIFADLVQKVFYFDINEEIVGQLLRVLFLGLLFTGFFYTVINSEYVLKNARKAVRKFDSTIVMTILIVLNLLFVAFVFIQFKHLFGSYQYVLNNNIVFSEYARKGFFELLWAVGLAFALFLLIFRSFTHHGMHKGVKILLLVFLAQTAVIAYSALHRMNLYQEAYGYTVQRLYAEGIIFVIMILLILGVVWLLASSLKFDKLFYVGCILIICSLLIAMSTNVDYIIARKNIARAIDGGKSLDVNYLYWLSVDMTPAVYDLVKSGNINKLPEDERTEVFLFIDNKLRRIGTASSLLEFNWGRFNAKNIADSL